MSQVGFQDYWVAGSRMYFRRDPVDSVVQAWEDLGTIQTVNPAITPEEATLVDPDGGVQTVVDQALVSIEESYDVTMNNLSLSNLSKLWLSSSPEDFTQTATYAKEVTHSLIAGSLMKIHDSDTDATLLYGLNSISGVYSGSPLLEDLTDVDASARTLTFAGSITVADGDAILIPSDATLTNIGNARTFTASGAQTSTTITVSETPAGDETGLTVSSKYGTGVLKIGVEWDTVSVDRGLIKLVEGGGVASGDFTVSFGMAALSGDRLLKPQTIKGTIQGKAILIYSRGNNTDQTMREMDVSVTPNSSNVQDSDFSNIVMTFKVLNDLTSSDPAGRVLQFKGDLPASS